MMKKRIILVVSLILVLLCVVGVVWRVTQSEYAIKIVVPSGNQGEYVYCEEAISSYKNRLEISSIDMPEDAGFVLKLSAESQETVYECTRFPKGIPMLIDVKEGEWYKIGISINNITDEDIVVVFHVKNVKIK